MVIIRFPELLTKTKTYPDIRSENWLVLSQPPPKNCTFTLVSKVQQTILKIKATRRLTGKIRKIQFIFIYEIEFDGWPSFFFVFRPSELPILEFSMPRSESSLWPFEVSLSSSTQTPNFRWPNLNWDNLIFFVFV
jgi:hypothetical protein